MAALSSQLRGLDWDPEGPVLGAVDDAGRGVAAAAAASRGRGTRGWCGGGGRQPLGGQRRPGAADVDRRPSMACGCTSV